MKRTAPWWRGDRFEPRLPALHVRAAVTAAVRAWFAGQDFLEVETPALQVSPGLEPHLKVFATELVGPHPQDRAVAHLHTSPEFAMKKLLVAGLPRIFQLARVYRNGERSATHHPEFTMLEWYRAGAGYLDLVADIQDLLAATADCLDEGAHLRFRGRACDPRAPIEIVTVAQCFERHAGIDLIAAMDDASAPDPRPLADAALAIGIRCAPDDRWEDIFFRIFLERIEPKLGQARAVVMTDYPACMAALSRIKPGDARFCERFELYICGLELANAFGELTDAGEQARRFQADADLRKRLYGDTLPVDDDFLAALAHGMPEAAGIALGFDRLTMLAAGADHIEQVLWAPVFQP